MAVGTTRRPVRAYGLWDPSGDGVTLSWSDVSVYTAVKENLGFFRRTKQTYRRIVNNVTGAVKPGSLVALMGGSGAGKSTLMAALAYRNPAGAVVVGDIRVNGRPLGVYMHRLSGFMHQEDLFVSSLTVREHLDFMARLRLDRSTTDVERQRKVSELLVKVGLTTCSGCVIGAAGQDKVLSGGEKKRLAFATELLTDPLLLFCDEPTTGLDSFCARRLVGTMRQMASEGRTVLCTIHQPSAEIFDLFHQLILIADGRIVFIGDAKSALEFFSSHGYECPVTYSPADFLVRTLAMTPGAEDASRQAVRRLCGEFAVSAAARQVEVTVQLQINMASGDEDFVDFQDSDFKAPSWLYKLQWLTYRSFLQVLRDPSVQLIRILQKIVLAVMLGVCYAGSVTNTQPGVQAIQGVLFLFVTENTFSPMYSMLAMFPLELPLFMREYRSGLYHSHLYYLSKMAAMLPGLILEPVLFVLIAYWLAGLRSTLYAFLMTAAVTTLTMNVSTACGCFFANAFDSESMAMLFLVPFDYVLMIMSGIFVRLSTVPSYIGWIQNLSWLMYSSEALSIIQWADVHNITCDTQNVDLPCLKEGAEVLFKYSFETEHLCTDIIAMAILCFTFHLFAYLCLNSRARNA